MTDFLIFYFWHFISLYLKILFNLSGIHLFFYLILDFSSWTWRFSFLYVAKLNIPVEFWRWSEWQTSHYRNFHLLNKNFDDFRVYVVQYRLDESCRWWTNFAVDEIFPLLKLTVAQSMWNMMKFETSNTTRLGFELTTFQSPTNVMVHVHLLQFLRVQKFNMIETSVDYPFGHSRSKKQNCCLANSAHSALLMAHSPFHYSQYFPSTVQIHSQVYCWMFTAHLWRSLVP